MKLASSAAATARAGAGQGHIHFVTPTNRWMGSIPLSTIDPLTLEPLSTYVRPDPPRRRDKKNEVGGEGIVEQEEEDDEGIEEAEDMKERTTNIAGDPISLILARLQTMPQGCACGCTVPDPPKHSDYYHAQHLLRLLFQTQRVRSRSLKMYLPEFFERFGEEEEEEEEEEEDEGEDDEDDFKFKFGQELEQEMEQGQGQELEQHQAHLRDSVVIPIDANNNLSDSTLALPLPHQNHHHQQQPPPPPPSTKRSKKIPRYVHSLVQNRNFRNPLTNTEIEGDATFFVVLEPGKGGWWHEPWAKAMRPAGVQGFHSLLHRQQSQHQSQDHYQKEEQKEHELTEKMKEKESEEGEGKEKKTPEMIQLEKELRKERWRQGRIVNLELEAQHEMDWRRWNRSQATYAAETDMDDNNAFDETGRGGRHSSVRRRRGKRGGRKMMRLKLAKDIALLESSELGLRLPRRVKKSRSECSDTEKMGRCKKNNNCNTSESLLSLSKEKKDVTCTTTIANTNNIGGGLLFRSVQASAVLDNVEMEDIRQQQKQQQEQGLEGASEKLQQQLPALHRRVTSKCRRRLARAHRTTLCSSMAPSASSAPAATTSAPSSGRVSQAKTPVDFSFLPWWDPDPRPFQMPSTKLSPFAISTLPEPVAKLFGGTSIYSLIPPPKTDAASTNTTTKDASTTSVSGATEVETESSTEIPTPAAKIPTKNTAGCQWVPVKHGDRVAVMMGTSKDFLLFPSFQRLLFRHLSREDFEDRVARANRIPCPATAIIVTNTTSGGEEAVQQQMREQGERIRQEVLQRQMLQQRQREGERDVLAMEEGDGSTAATAATSTGRGRTWIEWMSPRRHQNNELRRNNVPTTRTVNTATIGAELGIPLPLPPSNESTTAFVDGSSANNCSSNSSSSSGSDRSGRSSEEEEDSMRGQAEEEKYSSRADGLGPTPSSNNTVDMMDEKSTAAALDSALATTNNPSISTSAAHKATTNDKESLEEREQRWLVLEERFLREDYDSSDYSYASSSEDEYDELPLDYEGSYYSSEDSESSDGDDGSDAEDEDDEFPGRRRRSGGQDHATTTATTRWRWGIRDWIYFFTFCTPHPRTLTTTNSNETTGTNRGLASVGGPLESRRARRRRLRRERWQRIQNRQREQESAAFHRYLPTIIRRRMSAQDVHRCCMAAEFCRFYVTILMALALICAIVYGAVHVEASPPSAPRPSLPSPDVKDVMTQGGGSGGGGGGSLRRVPPGQWTSSIGMSGAGGEGVLQRENNGDGGRQQQQQKPLGSIDE